jgi:hypothetical protein
MPITFHCACGKALRVQDELGGKRVRCPACQAIVVAPEPELEVGMPLEDDPPPPPLPARRSATSAPAGDEDERPAKKPAAKWKRDEDRDGEEDEDRPRKKMKKGEKKDQKPDHFGIEKKIFRGGVIGGGVAMLVAVVWFVVGLINDIIFFYPPILFIIGLVAAIKGLVSPAEESEK